MTRKPPRRHLTPEDEALWQQVARTVKPFTARTRRAPTDEIIREVCREPVKTPAKTPARKSWKTVVLPLPRPDAPQKSLLAESTGRGHTPKLSNSWSRKIRRGRFEAEARLDLHGLTRDQAFVILHRFLVRALEEGRRSLLIITGKGRRLDDDFARQKPGVLKTEVPRWLRQGPLATHILSVQAAHPKDGGDGAYYVILRRDRTGAGRSGEAGR